MKHRIVVVIFISVIFSLVFYGCEEAGNTGDDTTPPGDVRKLESTAEDRRVVLSWNNPSDDDIDKISITYTANKSVQKRESETESAADTPSAHGPSSVIKQHVEIREKVSSATGIGEKSITTVSSSSTSATIDELENGIEYTFTVTVVDTAGNKSDGESVSATPVDVTPPAEVIGLSRTVDYTQIKLTWTNPSDSDFDHCEVWYGTGGIANTQFTGTVDCNGTTITGLTSGTEYTVMVKTVDASGNVSAGYTIRVSTPSRSDPDTTPPAEVSGLSAEAGNGEVTLTWNDPGDSDFDHVEITWAPDGSTAVEVASREESYTATALTNSSEYTFTVKTVDTAGNTSTGESIAATPSIADESGPNNMNAILDIPNGTITGTNVEMEYSLDDGDSWSDCGGALVPVSLSVEDRVWVRDKTVTTDTQYLGEVLATTGPDLVGGEFLFVGTGFWSDEHVAVPGDTHSIYYAPTNLGTSSVSPNTVTVEFYLSEDRTITTDDVLLTSDVYPFTIGLNPPTGGETVDFTVPANPGEYYVGMVLDTTAAVAELNEDNNASLPENVAYFIIENDTAADAGAIKIVNSWGTGNWGENKADGHYWLTYDSAKSLQMPVVYYHNSFDSVYEPRVLAVFDLTHSEREDCLITLGLGDPADSYRTKEFQTRWSTDIQSGAKPFPATAMALDISEFAEAINDYDLFLHVENLDDTAPQSGTIDSFSVEFYSDYSQAAFKTLSSTETPAAIPDTMNGTVDVSIATTGSLTSNELIQILPLPRSSMDAVVLHEEEPSAAQLAQDKAVMGVYEEGRNYNELYMGIYGTGYKPPTEKAWERMVRLTAVETGTYRGDIPLEVDHSTTQYFPPVGNQGAEGSCTAFSFAYYIHTYTEARERGWDLSGAVWESPDPSGGDNSGGPSLAYADKIFSPDFVYHAINDGEDGGSNMEMAAAMLTNLGCATWAEMPYDTSDHSSWAGESAYREAAQYRAREVEETPYWEYHTAGYFTITSDADIQLLKSLLAAGYCVQTTVFTTDLYDLLDTNDVVSGYSGGPMSTNHAQTIVGYKEGTEWNETTPDS